MEKKEKDGSKTDSYLDTSTLNDDAVTSFGNLHTTMLPNWLEPQSYKSTAGYNYKCPNCGGEFNCPSFIKSEGTAIEEKYVCPFCGKEMLGLK